MTVSVAANLARVKTSISAAASRAGRRAEDVRLLLVTKTVPPEIVQQAIVAGQDYLGENKVQEGLAKASALAAQPLRWSMIGHLQRNKVRDVLRFASEVQSIDRVRLAAEMEKHLQKAGEQIDVLVQVNTSGEESKYGVAPAGVMTFLKELAAFDCLRPKGFMTLATFTPDEAEVRRCFRLLRDIRDRARNDANQGGDLHHLSMGMSGDFEWAIEEGATIVRIGQAVFGPRSKPDSYYWPNATLAV